MITVIPIPAGDLPLHFSMQVDFEGTIFSLVFQWNSRDQRWLVSLYNANETVPIKGCLSVPLEPGMPILGKQLIGYTDGLPGFIQPVSPTPMQGVMADLRAMVLYYFDAAELA